MHHYIHLISSDCSKYGVILHDFTIINIYIYILRRPGLDSRRMFFLDYFAECGLNLRPAPRLAKH